MADTIRTRAALLALLADNTTQDISPQDFRDVLVSIMGVFGHIYVDNNSTSQGSIGTSFVKMVNFATDGLSDGVTTDATNDKLTIDYDGVYEVSFDVAFSGSSNTTFEIHAFKNGTELVEVGSIRKIGLSGDVGALAKSQTPINLVATDELDLRIKADGAGSSITAQYLSLYVKRIG